MLKKRIYNVIRTNLHQGTHTENILINLTLTLVCERIFSLACARNWDSYLNYNNELLTVIHYAIDPTGQ